MSDASRGAGASARREYERRKAKDEARLREKWGRFGGIAVALSEERQSTSAWKTGATGEERVAEALERIAPERIRTLHDRRIPGTRANIDHIVVCPAGVWVIDAKRYKGRPQLRIEGGILRPRVEKLFVGGRDQSRLVDGVIKQIDVVKASVGAAPVQGALCFVDADWPLIGGSFQIRGVDVLWPNRLLKLIEAAADSAVDFVDVHAVTVALAEMFRPA